jgi:hypothetical protein
MSTTTAADKMFTKEVTRFALNTQKECLESILNSVQEDSKTCGPAFREKIQEKLADIQTQLAKCGKSRGGGSGSGSGSATPRKLSAYNRFVKEQMSALVKNHPDMDNKTRMTKVSEMWRTLSAEDKVKYNA